MSRDIIRCQNCGKAITPEEAEVGISVTCPACSENEDAEGCCSEKTESESRKPGCGCC